MKKLLSYMLTALMLFGLSSFASAEDGNTPSRIDMSKWNYEAIDDVYWQTGLSYASTPADSNYETMGIFVPGAFFIGTDNGDGTYTCTVNETGTAGEYTALTAPLIIPVNTPGYSAMAAPTGYTSSMGYGSIADYTSEGIIIIFAGARGRDAGVPAGVTDFKAAIRYTRYNADQLPGDMNSIFSLGMSGGGAQSALLGATGNSDLYDPYLKAIGAVMTESDAVLGSMCWCPITNLDTADEAYEWMMGVTRSGLSEEEQQISDKLAEAFAEYINAAGIKDPDGNVLTLAESEEGIYQAGTYYDYMLSVIEDSLNNFLRDTEFPYEASSSSGGHGGPASFGGNGGPKGGIPGNGEKPSFGDGQMPDGDLPSGEFSPEQSFEDIDNISRNETSSGVSISGTYETAQDYIDALNANGVWITYTPDTNTAGITSIEDFVVACKSASKNLGAFDQLDAGQGENTLFGYGDGAGAHFDAYLAAILNEIGNDYAADYAVDLAKQDSEGNTVAYRVNMYTPLYYLLETSAGYQTSSVAQYWRIRTGIAQGDCALSTEMNLALALENHDSVASVDFETVWGAGHTQAERTGNSTENFISWVNECMENQ